VAAAIDVEWRAMTARNVFARVFGTLVVLTVPLALPTGCQSTPAATGGAQQCVLGETITGCVPDDGGSTARSDCTRTCLPDLSDYGPCLCPSDGGKKDAH
jgi:hypothetical protein